MPKMDGVGLIQALRARTRNLNADQVRWCLMLGVAGLIGGTISASSPAEWRWVSGLAIAAAAAAGFLAGQAAPVPFYAGPVAEGLSHSAELPESASSILPADFSGWSSQSGSNFETSRSSVRRVNELVQSGGERGGRQL